MAGLRDGLQRSRELYLPELDKAPETSPLLSANHQRSLPQHAGNMGFSVHGADDQSAWKRRFGRGITAPTETTARTTFLLRCALLHGLSGLLLAGGLTVLFLESMNKSWLWLLMLAMILAFYGVGAYWCAERFDKLNLARWLLLSGDLALLMGTWLLIGPSLILALLLPGLVVLALLLGGRRELLLIASLEAAALVVLLLSDLAGTPRLALHAPAALVVLVNLFGSLACLGGMIYGLLTVLDRNNPRSLGDQWHSAEVARVRIESDIHLRQLQDHITMLQNVLTRVAGGELHARVPLKGGELGPLAAKLNTLLDRQERMFDEARQHRRLEAAVGELIGLLETLHRGERVGWPAPTGTQVDRILALMRAPLPSRPLPRTTRELPAVSASEPAPEESDPSSSPADTRHRPKKAPDVPETT
ncbi:MAG TPA: hypothetical protein VKT82_21575 [Ktedonobacterales bacterium]|nr:hypothetical protein [Ktedonobacterales bacterium]